ncbi:NACHT, LRR and PYD domains-containing protein 1-like protein, partial [Frankliniella fusca]
APNYGSCLQESPARLCPRKGGPGGPVADTSPSPCRTDPACWTPPPPPTADSPLEPLPPIDLAVGGEPVGRVRRFLRAFHRELGGRDPPHAPPWAPPLPPGTTAPQRMDPCVCILTAGERVDIRLEQILSPVRTADGGVLEAPRRVLVEAGPAMGKTTLALRLLAAWADGAPWIPPDVTLAFLVPLRELRGNTLAAYLGKQLLPKSAVPANFDKIWRTILGLEERLLFVLDGYDEAVRGYPGVPGGREALGDALDLLEGRLLKEARVVLTCGSGWAHEVAASVQRRVLLAGLQWPQVESLSRTFFNDDDMADRFLDALAASEDTLQPLARAPLGWMALCSLYQDVQDLPEDPLQLHQALFRCIPRALSDIPPHSRKVLADLGRLALVAMKDDRVMYTDNELRVHCGSAAGVASLGFLCRGLNFGRAAASRRAMEFYTPVFRSMAEFLAAYYMSSVASYANILRRDLQLLPGLSEALSAGLGEQAGPAETVLLFLLGLLGRRGHLVLSQLSPLDATPRSVFPLLRAAGPTEDNVDAACRLLGAAAGPGPDQGAQATVHCRELELEGWACVLRAPSCTLASLELVVSADGDSRLEPLFSALAANRSLHAVLARARTHAFELVVACLEESAHDRFQCLVDALCAGLRAPSCVVARLLVDVNLNCAQLQQLLSALRGAAVRTLQLPHLGCGSAGLRALTQHLRQHHAIDALSLAGSWGARNHGASESGGSVGLYDPFLPLFYRCAFLKYLDARLCAGSGGSGSCFSSLPRGALGMHGSLSRPATLPRQPLAAHILGLGPGPVPVPGGSANDSGYGSADTKRGSDSLLWRGQASGALPVCDVASHAGSGFHDVFDAIRDASCQLRNLNVSKCLLSPGDATCLGAAVRGGSLTALRLEGAARLWEVLPALLALAADPPLQLLDASSPRLTLPDGPAQQVFTALAKNANLRLLSLDGWTFRFEEEATLRGLVTLLGRTGIRDLSLSGCRLHCAGAGIAVGRSDAELQGMLLAALASSAPDLPASLACTDLLFLRLAGLQVWVRDRVALRGPQLLPFLRGLGALRELDLSAEREDAAGPSTPGPGQPGPLVVDDKVSQTIGQALTSFWAGLSESLRSLQTLHMAHWRLRLDDPERTLRAVAKSMRSCPLVSLRADGLVACDANR